MALRLRSSIICTSISSALVSPVSSSPFERCCVSSSSSVSNSSSSSSSSALRLALGGFGFGAAIETHFITRKTITKRCTITLCCLLLSHIITAIVHPLLGRRHPAFLSRVIVPHASSIRFSMHPDAVGSNLLHVLIAAASGRLRLC